MAKDEWASPKAGIGKLIVFAFLIALFLFFLSFVPLGFALSGILFIPEWVFFVMILYFFNDPHGNSYDNQIVEISFAKLVWHEDNSGRGWQKERVLTYWKNKNIEDYLRSKGQNRIIAVMGSSRSGKSQLVYKLIQSLNEEKKIIFQFKATDNYTKLGYPVLYIHKAVPDVFVSPEAIARAFITAFPISTSMQGITASTVRGQVKQIAEKSKNWIDFKRILDDLYQHETDSITKGALKFIQNNVPIIYREQVLEYELPEACVVDFEGSENTEVDMQFFVFYSEFLLNQLSKEVWNKRQNTLFVIDEAHLLTKSGFSIIPEMSALIGAKGSMILASQRIADLQGQALDNCKTQFTFKQTGKENLDEVRAVSDLFHEVIGQMLSVYEFCDIGQDRPDQAIRIYRLINPNPVYFPVEEIQIGTEQRKAEEKQKAEKIDYGQEIIHALEHAKNVQDIAKFLSKKYRNSDSKENISYFKLKIKDILNRMIVSETIIAERTENIKFSNDKGYVVNEVVYCRKAGNPSDYHEYLVNSCAEILNRKGILPRIQPSGIGTADIETDDVVYEIETGLKNDITDIENRIKYYKQTGQNTIIIVPNPDTKVKYREKYPDIQILTLPELWEAKL
jgi:energy-coupling factor transporter transmembrane protein EcfT